MVACGTGSRAGLGSFGGRSLLPRLVLTVLQLQVPTLVGDGSALEREARWNTLSTSQLLPVLGCQVVAKYL